MGVKLDKGVAVDVVVGMWEGLCVGATVRAGCSVRVGEGVRAVIEAETCASWAEGEGVAQAEASRVRIGGRKDSERSLPTPFNNNAGAIWSGPPNGRELSSPAHPLST